MSGHKLSDAAMRDLAAMKRRVGRQQPQGEYGGGSHARSATWYWAKLSSDMIAGGLDDPQTFTFDIWLPDPDVDSEHPDFIVSTDSNMLDVTGVNRTSAMLAEDSVLKVEYAYGEWTPKLSEETWYWAKVSIGSEIVAGTLEAPTQFFFDVWIPDPDSNDNPRPFIITDNSNLLEVIGVNRSSMIADEDVMIKVEYAYNEWSPKWIDCPT